MSETADARGSKRERPAPEQEQDQEQPSAPAASGFAPVPVRRAAPAPASAKNIPLMPLVSSNETTQFQVPLELLVLARNKEKDKVRSVAVTPVAPRPSSDEPPPSSELSGLRAEQRPEPAAEAAGVAELAVAEPTLPISQQAGPADAAPPAARASGAPARRPDMSFVATLAWLLVAALCLGAGYCAVELLHWY